MAIGLLTCSFMWGVTSKEKAPTNWIDASIKAKAELREKMKASNMPVGMDEIQNEGRAIFRRSEGR